ncbi:MAG: amidase [Candidatus Heimdallarchaeota archaeon]|nr:amidase [Candidatus Heimdallarchaeota archaeon]
MDELTISDILELYETRGLTAVELVKSYMQRIKNYDKNPNGLSLNSIIELNADALTIASELDEYYRLNGVKGILHGIPILVKDNIDTAGSMQTTAGSLALTGNNRDADAFVVSLLREQGGIILGKTNLSEWANYRGKWSTSGWSSMGGQTRNPYDLLRTPCGSSSGTAVAIAANFAPVGIGTETDGSIICPSSINGIVGLKPSIGLVSRSGIIPIGKSQDTAGPMTRTVKDAAILLTAMVGKDESDRTTLDSPILNYILEGSIDRLDGMVIGVIRNFTKFNQKISDLFDSILPFFKDLGAELVDQSDDDRIKGKHPIDLKLLEGLSEAESTVLSYEFKQGLNQYLSTVNGNIQTIENVIEFNTANKKETLLHFGQEYFEYALSKGDLQSEAYLKAIQLYDEYRTKFDTEFSRHNLDAVILPSTGPAWLIDHVNGDNYAGGFSSSIAAITGYCSISLPMGYINGLPVGLSIISGKFQEKKILTIAHAFENATKIRIPPDLETTMQLGK